MERELKELLDKVHGSVGRTVSHAKLWQLVSGKKQLSAKTLDRLALLAGFQTWGDLHKAVEGSTDGQTNYGE